MKPRAWNEAKVERVALLVQRGVNIKVVAKEIHATVWCVYKILSRLGCQVCHQRSQDVFYRSRKADSGSYHITEARCLVCIDK